MCARGTDPRRWRRRCSVDTLREWQRDAESSGRDDFFPVAEHTLGPLRAKKGDPAAGWSLLLKDLLRNFTCDVDDGGSRPLRSVTWEWTPPPPCASGAAAGPAFRYFGGFLPAGDELSHLDDSLTEEEAVIRCAAHDECAGFTYEAQSRGGRVRVYFKSANREGTRTTGWHAMRKRRVPAACRDGAPPPPPPTTMRIRVDVLRDSPPVLVAHDFATEEECEEMMNETLPIMSPSVVFTARGNDKGSAADTYRQSRSANMYPDFDDETRAVTRLARRKFAFAREVADYDELVEGPGQEPINAVYYSNYDDQYRPHCDGECHGGRYVRGRRIASSLTYCRVADRGGFTTFTQAGLKVVPKRGQMLLFGYKLNDSPYMDDGLTEHSGCPLREGSKWVATQWYREGVSEERGWETFLH